MAFVAVAAIAAAGAVYTATEQRETAKDQARQQAEAAQRASQQAAETARANALAAQTAADRERAQATVKANVQLASPVDTPQVQLADQAPTEAVRRRTVRASFTADDTPGGAGGSIRV